MKRTPSRSGLSVAITTLLACQVAWAQQPASPRGDAAIPAQATIVQATLAQAAGTQDAAAQAASTPAQLDAVEVRGEYIPEPMLQTAEVASFITREDFERTGDGDAAAALSRVSGVSIVDDKFVYVRGLGERYSSALLNGSPLPSPEPMQRVVPLDLFPAEVLQGMTVQKTYSARYPGEFGGGIIDLQSLTIPDAPFFKLSVGGGGNSVTTGEKGLTYYGSEDDWSGYDDGTRKMPRALQDAIATGQRVDLGGDFSREDIRRIGRSFQNANLNLLQENDSINPDGNVGASAGYTAEMGEDARIGFIAVAGFENTWRTRFGDQQQGVFVNDVVEYDSDYDFLSTQNNARTNVLLGAGYEWGSNKLGLTTLYVHDTIKEARSRSGMDNLAGFEARDDYTAWFERELINHQLTGSHAFGEYDDLKIEWRAATARATRDVPYEKGIRYENVDGYWSHDASRVQNYTRFSAVEDTVDSAGLDVTWRLPVERDLTLGFGGAYMDNERNAWAREFKFLALDGALPFHNRYQRPDYLFSDYNLSQDLLRLRETTGGFGASAYDAALEVKALYLQAEGEITANLRATVGVRYEDATQSVTPYDVITGIAQAAPAPLENDYFLPALTLTWNIADNRQLRFGASRTIARPQFREMAPQQYSDPDSFRQFYGNPYLVDSELTNFDVRHEWFFGSGEYFTVGAFHKTIDKPIETNINVGGGGTIFQSFLNAPEATVYGAEVEFKKYFDDVFAADWWGANRLYLATNYTWSQSEVNADEGDTVQPFGYPAPVDARLFVRDGSDMQGQSEHIANLQFGVEDESTGLQATLIANHVSERVSARGRPGQPDYMQEPGTTLDFVLRKGFNLGDTAMTLGFAARNILDTEFDEYQERGGQKVHVLRYDPGVTYSLSLSAEF
ncbi:TonB-dependent receptor [Luteimonas sp. MC1782]|uniref:TonB-dependent receptor domain-containing protein n=1 Tax=Luteimonas sp. MC1782 TaxID=2760305 RepID=UPI001601CEC3|nr:TonB-dependent receptor [Luteimonas sp. MC1782]MBB1472423.1 TonB-dependent receptor [Luteimonas sp. MC1782]